jgi:hypothetical protein
MKENKITLNINVSKYLSKSTHLITLPDSVTKITLLSVKITKYKKHVQYVS